MPPLLKTALTSTGNYEKFLFDTWPYAHYHLIHIRHGQLVFASILEKSDAQISFCIAVYCSNASSDKLMECSLPCVRSLCLCNINGICGLHMASILNSFYYHRFHLTTTLMPINAYKKTFKILCSTSLLNNKFRLLRVNAYTYKDF